MTGEIKQCDGGGNGEILAGLKSALDYNPETGDFHWKVNIGRNGKVKAGDLAGNVSTSRGEKRRCIRFRNVKYLAYRLAWLLTYGKWPDGVIDHIDGNPLNNRLTNLRDVSKTVNGQNQRRPSSNNQSGFLGVSRDAKTGLWLSQIYVSKKKKYLGLFRTPEEGHNAYLAAKREFHAGCTI